MMRMTSSATGMRTMSDLSVLSKDDLAIICKSLMESVNSAAAVTDYLDEKGVDTAELKTSIGGVVESLQTFLGAYQQSIKGEKKD